MNLYEFHTANPDIFQQFSVKDILFLYYKCPQKEHILQLHSPYNQFTFAYAGKKIFHQGEFTYKVSKNSGFLLRRSAFLQEMADDIEGWELLAFYLKDDYLKSIFNEFRTHLPLNNLPETPKEMVIPMDINHTIRNCYLSLIPYFNNIKNIPEKLLILKLKELLYNVFINPKNQQLLAYVNNLADGYEAPLWEVMEANYMYDLSLEEFAQLANRSLSTFKRKFADFYETTPGKWLSEKRLARAKRFVATSDKSISDIAFEKGFTNLSHFSKRFKQQFGHSPTALRGLTISGDIQPEENN